MPPTIAQLEAFVSSPAYDADTAGLIALAIPALKAATGQPGELISPGVRRIRGNLCNVHGKYGPCDKALSGKKPKKGRAPAKPKKTDQQRAAERDQKRQANVDSVAKRMADSDTGLAPAGSKALVAFAQGTPPDAQAGAGFAKMGLAEQAQDGSYRMTPTGRAVVSAMQAGDYQRAVDGISRAGDAAAAREGRVTARQQRQAETAQRRAGKRPARQAAGDRAAAQIADRLNGKPQSPGDRAVAQIGAALSKRQPRKASAGGKKKPDKPEEKPLKLPARRRAPRSSAPSVGGVAGASANKKPPKPDKPAPAPKPDKAPAKQLDPKLTEAATALSDGKQVSDEQLTALVRNGLVKLNKDGDPVLTAAGQRATMKAHDGALRVFKDANGADRWVAQSSTAFQDRDREIVSTKALADDCAYADQHGSYGPLRWWHTPGLDLGDCDFNAMHGRVLIESGTFRSAAIAQKVARAADGLEISLGFLHLPSEPDADGVFHHIRRFERSLVPRGKASNRFTAFTVKETRMFDATKVAALKTLGFTDDDITSLQAQAAATEKSADDQGVAYKAEEPTQEITIAGVTYQLVEKAAPMPPVEEATDAVVEEDAIEPMDEAPDDPTALTLSQGDLAALGEMITAAVGQIMGGLDLEKKVAGHVQGLMAPFQQQQATKEAGLETRIAELQQQLTELNGNQPATPYRASQASNSVLNDATVLAAVKTAQDSGAGPWDDIIKGLGIGQAQ
jgi:hypothetical protein